MPRAGLLLRPISTLPTYQAATESISRRGAAISAHDYIQTQIERNRFRIAFEELFDQVDVLITPATPLTAFPVGTKNVKLGPAEEDARTAATRVVPEAMWGDALPPHSLENVGDTLIHGPLRVWTGVRTDVDWAAVAKPRAAEVMRGNDEGGRKRL